jgi:membrane protease YdiL (CAAX protease family)
LLAAQSGSDASRQIAALMALAVACWVVSPPAMPRLHASLSLLVLAPTFEEIVFRGGLQEWLLRRLGNSRTAMANLLTAAVFAAAHVAARPTLASLLTVLPALAIGVIYQRSRCVVPCIAAHVVFNGIWLLWVGLSVSA